MIINVEKLSSLFEQWNFVDLKEEQSKNEIAIPNIPKLEIFFEKYKSAISPKEMDLDKLSLFFEQWKGVELEKEKPKAEIVISNISKLGKFFEDYHVVQQEFDKQKLQGLMVNVWQAANLGRNEVRNSKTLRWFLDQYASHGQKSLFLKEFLKCLPEHWASIPVGNYSATEECCPLGNESERVDVEIDAENFLLFIEVKIDAIEGEKQLERYQYVAQQKAQGRPWGVVYLTRDGILPKEHQNKANVMGISWKQLANQWQIFAKKALAENPNNRSIWLLEQFTYHILAF